MGNTGHCYKSNGQNLSDDLKKSIIKKNTHISSEMSPDYVKNMRTGYHDNKS